MIITFANHKGGVGKTALALVTAETLIANNAAIDIFDFDPQHNLTQQLQQNGAGLKYLKDKMPDKFDNRQGKYVLIDTAPGIDAMAQKALSVADVIVVPIETDISSLHGLNYIVSLKPNAKIIVVVNKYNAQSKLAQHFAEQIVTQFAGKVKMFKIRTSQQLQTNINTGKDWNANMQMKTATQFFEILKEIIKEA